MEAPSPPLEPKTQLEVGKFLLEALAAKGLEGVIVGTAAVVATGVVNMTSKDSDVVVTTKGPPSRVRKLVEAMAKEAHLRLEPQAWGVLTLKRVREGEAGRQVVVWSGDIILPSGGMIPPGAAQLIQRHALQSPWGKVAVEEHVIATKAVAAADRASEGQVALALKYEQHLEMLARGLPRDVDWKLVRDLLLAYIPERRNPAAELIRDIFGVDPLQRKP